MEKFDSELARLQQVLLDSRLKEEMPPLFYNYLGWTITSEESIRTYFHSNAILLRDINGRGKEVVDIGCGFGLRSICLLLLGCKNVLGIDISPEMITGLQTLLKRFPELSMEAKQADFLLTELPPASFDVALLFEAVSHIRDTSALLDKIKEILRPSGVLYIRDGNNDLFLTTRLRSRQNWERSEYGPIDEQAAKHGREIDRLPFLEARTRIIQGLHPSLDARAVETIARKTKGMWGEEIAKAAREFLDTGEVRQKPSFPYRNPYSGEFPELGINPLRLRRELNRRGFECRFLPPPFVYGVEMPTRPRRERLIAKLVAPFFRIMPEVMLPFSLPGFHLKAVKLK